MKDIVKYNNDFNLLPMPELTAKEMDIFMLVISKFQYESRELVFDGYEFFRALKDPKESYQDLFDSFERFADKILSFNIKYKTRDKAYAFVCFESFKMDFTTNKVRIKAQEDFYNMILSHNLGYTRFELLEFANLSGKYTKTLYRLLKQFRQTGFLKMEWDEFSRIMQIPADYNQSNIDQFILKPAIKELTKSRNLFDQERIPFENLAYIKTKSRGRGGKVIGIEFSFKPQPTEEQKDIYTDFTEKHQGKIFFFEKFGKFEFKGLGRNPEQERIFVFDNEEMARLNEKIENYPTQKSLNELAKKIIN